MAPARILQPRSPDASASGLQIRFASAKFGQQALGQASMNHARAKRAFDGGAGKIGTAGASAKRGNEQMLGVRSLPILRGTGVFKRDAAAGIVLREAAPGGEVELVGLFQLREITFQARAFGEQAEDAPLIENVDVVFPDHVVDGRKPLAIANQRGRQAGEAIVHAGAPDVHTSVNAARRSACATTASACALKRPSSCGHPPGNGNGDRESGAIYRMRETFGRHVAGRAAQFARREQHGTFGDHRGGLFRLAPTRAAFDAAPVRETVA